MATEERAKPTPEREPSKNPRAPSVDAVVPKAKSGKPPRRALPLPWILAGVGVLALAGILGALTLGRSPRANTNGSAGTGRSVARALDGVVTNAENPNPTPAALVIENIVESRPQSGLNDASVVYEALAEGGITRFLAVFGPFGRIPEIGPVRSARPYFVDWAGEYGALFGYVGGSPQALDQLRSYRGVDLNEFFNNRYFWRDRSRPAPHNVYTSSDKLIFARRDKKVPETASYTPWRFADREAGPARSDLAQTIAIPFSSFNYNVEWKYDPTANRYGRSQAGAPHLLKDGSAVTAKNVIVQYVRTTLIDPLRLEMETVGSGRATVFRDGQAVEATWTKSKSGEHTQFTDTTGSPVPLNPGTTWVEVVPTDRTVTIT